MSTRRNASFLPRSAAWLPWARGFERLGLVVVGLSLAACATGSLGESSNIDTPADPVDAGPEPVPDAPPPPPPAPDAGEPDAGEQGVALQWLSLPAGTFQMGSAASAAEQPIHEVAVPAFELTKAEITVAKYLACVEDGSCVAPGDWSEACYWNSPGFENHPVNCVNWDRAVAFCAWAGGRLPSEAEWEYAARSRGQQRTYPWGEETPSCSLAVMQGCEGNAPRPVCSITTGNTDDGLCDMAGNVWEWVQDGYVGNYEGAPTDGSAREGGLPLVRGGGFEANANRVRTSFRGLFFGREYENTFIGFRCARSSL